MSEKEMAQATKPGRIPDPNKMETRLLRQALRDLEPKRDHTHERKNTAVLATHTAEEELDAKEYVTRGLPAMGASKQDRDMRLRRIAALVAKRLIERRKYSNVGLGHRDYHSPVPCQASISVASCRRRSHNPVYYDLEVGGSGEIWETAKDDIKEIRDWEEWECDDWAEARPSPEMLEVFHGGRIRPKRRMRAGNLFNERD